MPGPDGRVAVTIEVPCHWIDHHFQGRAVLPAVEAMQLLAHWAHRFRPGIDTNHLRAAAFDKFLELPPAGERIAAWCAFEQLPDGSLKCALLTKTQAKSSRMTRTKVHARVVFHPCADGPHPAALDFAPSLEGVCFSVAPQDLYRDLVPFGPGFQTITQPVQLTVQGARAVIRAPERWDGQTDQPLGSAFVLDAAFHAACVWSQRYAGVVAFPVGIDRRSIFVATRPGEAYEARVFAVPSDDDALLAFDIWIIDTTGNPAELLQRVRMRDVSGGRLKPPDWIKTAISGDGRREYGR